MMKWILPMVSVLGWFVASFTAVADNYYQCNSIASCHCIPSGQPGSGKTCDYFGGGQGPDQSSAMEAAKANVLETCENACTRRTGNDCYSVQAYNCLLVKP